MSVDALCVGHAAWDLYMYVSGYPAENSKSETDLLMESGGGPAANAAWLLRRWGVPTGLAALVGQDDYGNRVLKELTAAEVDCQWVEQREDHATPVSFIVVNRATGSRTVINRKAPASPLQLERGRLQGMAPQLLLFDGHELDASLAALQAFPSAVSVLDAGSVREGTSVLAGKVRYLVCSERFAVQVTEEREVWANRSSCLRRLRDLYGTAVAVTLGAAGCIFEGDEDVGHISALPVKAVDTTAAGDIFHGAFAYGLLRGLSLRKSLELATVAAGCSVERLGGRPSTPELETVLERLPRD